MLWHTKHERKTIKQNRGVYNNHLGVDGWINGRPVEVREAKKDDRFRIQQNIHSILLRQHGAYIFITGHRIKKLSANKVNGLLTPGEWFEDRHYPHKFLKKKQIFF